MKIAEFTNSVDLDEVAYDDRRLHRSSDHKMGSLLAFFFFFQKIRESIQVAGASELWGMCFQGWMGYGCLGLGKCCLDIGSATRSLAQQVFGRNTITA